MNVYKIVDEYSRTTGEKCGSRKVFDHSICDFTGLKIDEYENPNIYQIDFNDNDPCFGDGDGERWFYKLNSNIDSYEFFGQCDYVFKTDDQGCEIFEALINKATKELKKIYSLDHLLRWSRGKMLEKLISEGKYQIDQFIS